MDREMEMEMEASGRHDHYYATHLVSLNELLLLLLPLAKLKWAHGSLVILLLQLSVGFASQAPTTKR